MLWNARSVVISPRKANMPCYLFASLPPPLDLGEGRSAGYMHLHPPQHMETFHAEGQSPFKVNGDASSGKGDDDEYVECPIDGCGEVVLLEEIGFHVELHAEEAELDRGAQASPDVTEAEGATPGPSRSRSPPPAAASSRQKHAIRAWGNLLAMPSSRRRAADAEKHSAADAVQTKRLGVRRRSPVAATTS